MHISAATWATLSRLLDQALDLEAPERATWLQRQAEQQPEYAALLHKLLAAHATSETADILARLPVIAGDPVSREALARRAGLDTGQRVGPYRLKRELGSGGMADVWLAERADGAFVRDVALKLPRVSRLRRDLAIRFERERDILARLEHPHIARLYDAGVTLDEVPYLAMEFVDGRPIDVYCDAQRLDIATRLCLFGQVLDAAQYAHANLVIHRDLKPSNILVTADGQARLLDFGIAKLLATDDATRETQLTQLSGRALTPDYASPEQIRGEPLTTASDVYSLGVVLYELLAGRRPYRLKLESVAQLEQAILGADPAKPSVVVTPEAAQARATSARRLARELAGDLDTIVLKALHKAPAQRYATIAAFAGDLQRHQAGEPVHARPASWGYRARKFVARNRLAVGATAAVGAALIAATTVSLRQAQHARQQAARADEVKQYVLSIFADTDPFAGGSRNNTAVELLRQARDRLAAAPVTDAAIRVELLTSIGSGLVALGDVQQALPALDEATRLAVAHLKENDPNRLAAQLAQGSALVVTREARGAAPLIEAALDGMRRNHDTVGLIEALRWRSLERLGQSRFDESIADATEAVRLGEAQSTMTAKRALMQAYVRLTTAMMVAHRPGRLEPARRAYALALELHGAATHPQVLWTRVHYASALVDEGDPHSGLAELQAIAQPLIESAGQDHPYVGVLFWGIGKASLTLGDPLAAADAYRHALTGDLAVSGGRPSRRLALTHLRLASALLAARRLPEAQAEVRLANEVSVSAPWANEVSQRAKAISALLLQRSGHLAEADAVYTDLLALPHTEGPDEAPVIEVWLGALRSAQGRHAEALALLGTSVAFFSKKPKSIEYARTLVALGAAQLEDDRASEALQTLQQGDALLAKLQPNSSPERADVLVSLARAHLALGRVDEAVKASAAAAAFWIRYDPSLRETGIALLWHARALTAAGDAAKAAAAANQAGAILASVGAPDDRSLVEQAKRDLRAARR